MDGCVGFTDKMRMARQQLPSGAKQRAGAGVFKARRNPVILTEPRTTIVLAPRNLGRISKAADNIRVDDGAGHARAERISNTLTKNQFGGTRESMQPTMAT
jgi:hypothetical protein